VSSDQGYYDGYAQEDFDALLKTLAGIKGKFLLSSFRNKTLSEFSRANKWETVEVVMACSTGILPTFPFLPFFMYSDTGALIL
jgi:hypothetical protein